jgi:phasin family protein
MSKNTDTDRNGFNFNMPQFDMSAWMERFKNSGFDAGAIIESQKKNMDALIEANRKAAAGYQTLFARQQQIMDEAMNALQEAMSNLTPQKGGKPASDTQSKLMEVTMGKALANMKELAELAAGANSAAFKVMQDRAMESIEELKAMGTKFSG